jgi:hypothetical protein
MINKIIAGVLVLLLISVVTCVALPFYLLKYGVEGLVEGGTRYMEDLTVTLRKINQELRRKPHTDTQHDAQVIDEVFSE